MINSNFQSALLCTAFICSVGYEENAKAKGALDPPRCRVNQNACN